MHAPNTNAHQPVHCPSRLDEAALTALIIEELAEQYSHDEAAEIAALLAPKLATLLLGDWLKQRMNTIDEWLAESFGRSGRAVVRQATARAWATDPSRVAGRTQSQLASELGCSQQNVSYHARKFARWRRRATSHTGSHALK
jgi:hypothetical protein